MPPLGSASLVSAASWEGRGSGRADGSKLIQQTKSQFLYAAKNFGLHFPRGALI